ncbi:hypothetical protein [Reyranella sp.]|uniref:hypothetical protein n=1 Tax=Reyranella sp. TaxID=1929291 RepID=UPI003BAD86AA
MSGSPQDYDSIAGFDTSALTLDAGALQSGALGTQIAAAAFANLTGAARYANGVALIEAVGADNDASPVLVLLSFAHALTQLDGDASHPVAAAAEVARLIVSGELDSGPALSDLFFAVFDRWISRSEALQVVLALGATDSTELQLRAGIALRDIVSGSSEDGGLTAASAIQAIEDAVTAGSLTRAQADEVLVGAAITNNFRLYTAALAELQANAGGDIANVQHVIDLLLGAVAVYSDNIASTIYTVATTFVTPAFTLPQMLDVIGGGVAAGTVSPAGGLTMMLGIGSRYDSLSVSTLEAVATEVNGLIHDGVATAADTIDTLYASNLSLLIAFVSVDPDMVYPIGRHLAELIDTTSPLFSVPGGLMTAQDARTAIVGAFNTARVSAPEAVVLLAAMATVPGGATPDRNALNVAADGIRDLLSGAIGAEDAVATIVAALEPLGLTAAQGVTALVGLGGSGAQQILGNTVVYVGNPDLVAAAAAGIARLVHDQGLTEAALGAAFDGVFPLGVDSAALAMGTIVQAAVALAAVDPQGLSFVGAALALSDGASPYAMSGVSDGLLGGVLDSAAAIAMVVGYASEGSAGEQVAAGRELSFVLNQQFISATDGVAEIADAVAAGLLGHGEAILLLAGAATATPPVGLPEIFAQLAAEMDADPAAGAAVLEAAVTSGVLDAALGVFVLAETAALGSVATADALSGVLLAWVDGGAIGAGDLALQLVGLAGEGTAALQGTVGAELAAVIGHGALASADVLAVVEGAVPATLAADGALVVLIHMAAAGDSALREAAQTAIGSLIGSGAIAIDDAIAEFQAMLPGASGALLSVLEDELAILLTDPATLADTAGLGSPAQVQAAAILLASLFTSDPTLAQSVLDALAGRIEAGTLTGGQAATLLAKVYAQGGDGAPAVLAAIADLTTVHGGQAAPDIGVGTMADAIAVQANTGGLTVAEVFAVFGDLATRGAAAVNGALAGLVSGGVVSVDALDAAVAAGQYGASNAVSVLGSVVSGAARVLRDEALAEIQALVSATPALASQAYTIFIDLALSGDHDTRLVGYQAIEALAAVAPGIGDAAFLELLSLMPLPDAGIRADSLAELTSLVAGGFVATADAIQHIANQLSPSNGSPLVNPFQALTVLVALSAVADARDAIYAYIGQVTAASAAAQANGNPVWGFTATQAITALANGAGADLGRVAETAAEIASIGTVLTSGQILSSLGSAGALTAHQQITLVAEVAGFLGDAGAPAQFGTAAGGWIAGLSTSEQRDALDDISGLVGFPPDHLTASKAVEFLLSVYATGARAAVLAELADIAAGATAPGGVATAIVGAMVSGTHSAATGVDALAALVVAGGALGDAAVAALERALADGQLAAAAVMPALDGSIAAGTLTAAEALGLLQEMLLLRFEEASASDPATAALQEAVLGEIESLIVAGQVTAVQAVTAMAAIAAGASSPVLAAIGGEIAAFVAAHPGSDASSVAAVVASATAGTVTGAEAAALLADAAAAGPVAFQVAVGGGIAALVAAGDVTTEAGAAAVYTAFLDHGLTLDGLVTVTAGVWAAGAAAVGAQTLYQVTFHGFATAEALAASLADAVSAGMLSAAAMVAGSVAFALESASIHDGAVFLSTLIADGLLAADAAVVQLAEGRADWGLTADQTVALVAHLAADLPASESLLGVGLAEAVVAGDLTFTEIGAGLGEALAASPAVLAFADAAALLIGAATVTQAAAAAGATLIALIGSDSQRFADAIEAIDTAVTAATIDPAGALYLLAGLAGGGTQGQQLSVGAELAALVDAGLATVYAAVAAVMAEVNAGHLSPTGSLFAMTPLLGDAASNTLIVANLNTMIGSGLMTAGEAATTILAAVHDGGHPLGAAEAIAVLVELAENHVQPPVDAADRAVIVAAASALAGLVSSGDVTAATLLGDLVDLPAFGGVPLLTAIAANVDAASVLGEGLQAALNAYLADPVGQAAIVGYAASVMGAEGLTAAQALPVLIDLATEGGVVAEIALGEALAGQGVAMADLRAAFGAAGVTPALATMVLAAMLDPDAATVPEPVLREIIASLHEPPFTTDYSPYVQPVIAALVDAVLADAAVHDANGLRYGQVVLALSAYAQLGDSAVRELVAQEIVGLVQQYGQGYDTAVALLAKATLSLAANGPSWAAAGGAEIALVGATLHLTAGELATAVVAGVDHGLTAADVAGVLAYMTVSNPSAAEFDGPILYPEFGLAAGMAMADLVGDDLAVAQVLNILVGVTDIQPTSHALLLTGLAAGVGAADRILIGQALAELTTANIPVALSQVSDAVSGMLVLGLVESDSPIGTYFLANMSDAAITTLVGSIDASVGDGSLPPADAVQSLALLAGGFGLRPAGQVLFPRTALAAELVALVPDRIGAADAMAILLTPRPGTTGVAAVVMQAEAGALIAALVDAGRASPAAVVAALADAVDAGTFDGAVATTIAVGAALHHDADPSSHGLAVALGDWLGGQIDAGALGIAPSMTAILAAQTNFRAGDVPGEVALLAAMAGHAAAGLQAAIGQALAGIHLSGLLAASAVLAVLDSLVDTPQALSAQQAKAILFAMADAFDDVAGDVAGSTAVAAEFVALIGRGALAAQEVVDGVTAEIDAGHLTMANGLAFMAWLAAFDGGLTGIVTQEILALIGQGLDAGEAIDGLLVAPHGGPAAGSPDGPVVAAVAHIVAALHEAGAVTWAEAAAAVTAAQALGTLAIADAAAILVGLADAADEAAMAVLGAALGDVVGQGLDPDALLLLLTVQGIDAGLIEPAAAASLVAYVAGGIASLPAAGDYLAGLATVLAAASADVAVAAVDRAYAAGGLAAGVVVGLLVHLQAQTGAADAIAPELTRIVDDGATTFDAIFREVGAHVVGARQGELISAMALAEDTAGQVAIARALGATIASGALAFDTVQNGIQQAALGDGLFVTLMLGMASADAATAVAVSFPLLYVLGGSPSADEAALQSFEQALAAGVLTPDQLAQVLAGMGAQNSATGAATATHVLDALVEAGTLTATDAMASVDAAVPWLNLRALTHWLAAASGAETLRDAIAAEIVTLIDGGALTQSQALGYIGEIVQAQPGVAITWPTAVQLYVGLAGHGDSGLQQAAGAQIAPVATVGSQYLDVIDAAVTGGSLTGEGAAHVIGGLLAALTSDPGGAVRLWAASHLHDYVTDGLVDSVTVSAALLAAATSAVPDALFGLGAVMGTIGADISAIHDAVDGGILGPIQGLQMLIGVAAVPEVGDPAFQAARDEIVALARAGTVTVAEVMAATQAAQDAAVMDGSHAEVLAFSLYGAGSAADDAAIGAYFAAQADHLGAAFGAGDDAYFTGILEEAGVTFLQVRTAQMTAAEAIAHIKDYAASHDVSAYAGIYVLDQLFARYQDGAGHTLAHQARVDMIATGELAIELAGRVAEHTTSAFVSDGAGSFRLEAADPAALTKSEALAILNEEATNAYLPADVAQARYVFADALWVAEQVRIDTVSFTSISQIIDAMRQGNPTFNPTPDIGRTAYAFDVALTSLAERLASPDRPPEPADYAAVVNELSTRILKGVAADTLVVNYAAGLLTIDQVEGVLDREAAAATLGSNGIDPDIMHAIALAWLQLRGRQYVANHAGTDGAVAVGQMLLHLQDARHSDDLLTGFGSILGMSSSGAGALVTTLDKQMAYREAFDTIRSHTPSTLTLSERDQAVIDALTTMGNGMAYVLDRHPLGRSYVNVLDDPAEANAWLQFGTQVGIVVANKAVVDAMFAGTPWGLAITATKFGAQAALYVLSMGAVQDALGEGPTAYLHGQLTIAAATASLIGNTISDLGTVGVGIAAGMAPHFIDFSSAVGRGDAVGIASSIGELALDYYKLQTGVDPRLYGVVGERFADLIVHLFTGDTGELGNDVKALGAAYLDLVIKNPYLHAIGDRMVEFAGTINEALAEINDSYRILGQNVLTGLLYVGTGIDSAGNVLRSVAHTVGGFFSDVLHGLGIDGYISGATVFADANFNGVLDAGELSTVTDANGNYVLPRSAAPLVLQGGIDTATLLPFAGTMQAPAGSTVVTPLTTLVQRVAASGSGDPVAAQQAVAAALGLPAGLDLGNLDPIAATRTGAAGGAGAFAQAASVLNTASMLSAAGAADPFDAIADEIAAAAADRRVLNLTDTAFVANLVAAAGVAGDAAGAATQLITASNALTARSLSTAADPLSFLRAVSAVSLTAQGDTAHALAAAGADPALLADVIARYTGANLANHVADGRDEIGHFGDTGAGGGEVPLAISLDGRGIELAPGGLSVAGNWVKFSVTGSSLPAGSTLLIYAVDASGNPINRDDHHAGSDVTLEQAVIARMGGVMDDHGASLFMGSQSVYLQAGEQLRFAVLNGHQGIDAAPSTQLSVGPDGWLQGNIGGLRLHAMTNNALSDAMDLASAQRSTDEAFLFLRHGDTVSVEVAGSSANANTLGFVRFDVDAATGAWSVGGVAYGETASFANAVRSHMDVGFQDTHGGNFHAELSWTVAGDRGYYAPVLITQSGEVFVVGTSNPGGHEQIRIYGENTFGFEDLAYNRGSDFDYNDMVLRVSHGDHIL